VKTADSTARYARQDWDDECFAVFGEGRDPRPCPVCAHTGFYGPRITAPDRHYRQCRFCGFTQDVGGEPETYVPTAHACLKWPTCARAPYLWWVPAGTDSYRCTFCGEQVAVADARVVRPVDDPDHPWWRVPQGRNRFYYQRFWENWPVTQGRTFV
jgi:hypothetical protein